jgi:hypothetical protein
VSGGRAEETRNVTHFDLVGLWKWGAVARYPQDELRQTPLPKETIAFLTEVGLPEDYVVIPNPKVMSVRLFPAGDQSERTQWKYWQHVTNQLYAIAEWVRYPSHGRDLEHSMPKVIECFEAGTGKIYLAEFEDTKISRVFFVNSSIERYAICLVEFMRLMDEAETPDDVTAVEDAMRAVDAEAMDDHQSLWRIKLRSLKRNI